jgi:Uma2 family endonuclease
MSRTVPSAPRPSIVPPLQNGDRLTRAEFERRYDATRGLKKAELIEGVVYMPPPVSLDHSDPHGQLMTLLGTYRATTPGVLSGGDASLRLDMDNMPQPDAFLMIAPAHGGQARISDDRYIEGAPELVGEIAATTASYDLHQKLSIYRRSGVREYVVWRTLDRELDYFILSDGRYDPLPADENGIHRSETFPGLWLDSKALLAGDLASALNVLQQGLAGREHGEFVQRLSAAGR